MADRLNLWAQAIARQEGFYNAGNRASRNNNPGNLRIPGDTGLSDSGGFGIFSSPEAGLDALKNDLAAKVKKYPDYSILEMMNRYLGGMDRKNVQVTNQGDPFTYAKNVASHLGVKPTDRLGEVFAPTTQPQVRLSPQDIIEQAYKSISSKPEDVIEKAFAELGGK